jgi:chromosome segregation ATPase
LNHQLAQLDTELDRANNDIKNKSKEITSLRIQIDRENEERGTITRKLEVALRENKRLQDDLIQITRENQVLHIELDKTNMEKERLKDQTQDYINEVSKCEELLNQKVGFEQYCSIKKLIF